MKHLIFTQTPLISPNISDLTARSNQLKYLANFLSPADRSDLSLSVVIKWFFPGYTCRYRNDIKETCKSFHIHTLSMCVYMHVYVCAWEVLDKILRVASRKIINHTGAHNHHDEVPSFPPVTCPHASISRHPRRCRCRKNRDGQPLEIGADHKT